MDNFHPLNEKKDLKLAAEWLQKAAKSGDPLVLVDIGQLVLDEDGPMYDPGIAALVLPDAAKAGNRDAQYLLGKLYYDGLGVKEDIAIAFRLLNASAGQGRPEALALVAGMYLRGEGTEKNPQAAYVCAEMADDGGWPFYGFSLEDAVKLMTPEQLEQAKAVVEQRKAANAKEREQRQKEWDKLNPKAPETK
jgi:TPR repeat protein